MLKSSKLFPAEHPVAGQPAGFLQAIKDGPTEAYMALAAVYSWVHNGMQ